MSSCAKGGFSGKTVLQNIDCCSLLWFWQLYWREFRKQLQCYQFWWNCVPFLVMTEFTLMLFWFYRAAILPHLSVWANRNTLHNTWPHFHMHTISFQKCPLHIYRVSRRIRCFLSVPVFHPCWNCNCEITRGDKLSCCATAIVHTVMPHGILSGNVPCSQAECMHLCTAFGWRSTERDFRKFW